MKDSEFLNWVAERMVHVYGESPNVDFVHRARAVAANIEALESYLDRYAVSVENMEVLRAQVEAQAREIERLDMACRAHEKHREAVTISSANLDTATQRYIESLEKELAALKAQPSGVVLPEPMKRGNEGGSGEYGAAMIRGYNACLREVARLNSSPASAGDERAARLSEILVPIREGYEQSMQACLEDDNEYMADQWREKRDEIDTALSANHSEQVREECRHEFSDDGEFTVHCSKCDLTINAEPPRHVLDSAAQQAFEAGGTEDGGYVLTGDDLDQIVAQACAEAVIEFAAAPSAGSQEKG